jgi:hypothetical protein
VLFLAAAALAFCLAPAPAGATQLFQDHFTYANGNLVGQGGWFAHSGGGSKAVQVFNGEITVAQSAGSGEDDNHPFPVQGILGKTYVSFKLKIPAGSVLGSANDYFLHFRPDAPDTNNFVTRIFVGPPTAGGDYVIGVGSGSLTTTPLATWAAGLSFGQTYRVVAAYDPVGGGSQLWVDPVNESSTNANTGASATVINKPLASVAVRQASPAGATDSQVIDQLAVATTFDEALLAPPVPGFSTWGLLALAALLVVGAGMVLRRRDAVA